jgi:hypothetical protein
MWSKEQSKKMQLGQKRSSCKAREMAVVNKISAIKKKPKSLLSLLAKIKCKRKPSTQLGQQEIRLEDTSESSKTKPISESG